MRTLEIGSRRYTEVVCLDEPGSGGACHAYEVRRVPAAGATLAEGDNFAVVSFQDGPIKEAGINGCHNEDLIAIVIDRLRGFQDGMFKCRENAIALTKLEEALLWLNSRTQERMSRGVEGTTAL